MCGVAGVLDPSGTSVDVLSAEAESMAAALAHRGPDDQGVWCDAAGGVALAHTRLAVLDLSDAGHQPMVSASGRFVLTFNGEIYNYLDLRDGLSAGGARFSGSGDTEVLVAAVEEWGVEGTLKRLNGMFALGVWDRRERTLTLARDRLGEKPLYYGAAGRALVFASELGALRAHPRFVARLDHEALAAYVRLSYVPAPRSIYAGVRKLPAGCYVVVDADGSAAPPVAYWSLEQVARSGLSAPVEAHDDAIVTMVEELLRDSVRRRLASDVPLGAFLSGGVDSSLVVALMQSVASSPVRTYTVSVGGRDGDESHLAAEVAAHLGTDHTTITLSDHDAVGRVPAIAGLYDEPFGDPSQVPVALMCELARQHVTVCVSGDGGDEAFAGYNRYLVAHGPLAHLQRLPRPVRAAVGAGLRRVPTSGWDRLGAVSERVPPALATKVSKLVEVLAAHDPADAYRRLAEHWDVGRLLQVGTSHSGHRISLGRPLEDMLLADQRHTLPDDMLVKVDRASMAVALEVRVPLLDHRLVELAWRLPRRAKVRGGRGKWVLRQALHRHLPRELVDRPKLGFDPPLGDWLRGPLREWAGDLLSPARLDRQGLFDSRVVSAVWQAHQAGEPGHDYPLWLLAMCQSWFEATRLEPVS